MFQRARWRLTLWFAGTVALIFVVIGVAVFATARQALFDGIDDDLESRARREVLAPLAAQRFDPIGQEVLQFVTAGGYFYAITNESGELVSYTSNVDPESLVSSEQLPAPGSGDVTYVNTKSSDGDDLRIYVRPIETRGGRTFYLQVGRSSEPERQALQRLLIILVVGGGAGLGLAMAGGFWLAGRALTPIKTAMDKQQEFVADASHELRTPLALIRANAEILKREGSLPVDANMSSVDDIIHETDRLAALVTQMLTLARSDAGKETPEMVPVDLNELAEDTAREMRLLAGEKEISIDVRTNGDTVVAGDPLRLRELLTILLDNSLKYSDEGDSVTVDVRPQAGQGLLQVSDTGRGIPEEALPRIFERFYRADKARAREMGGSGLGLSIAKWIADVHRGTIGIESEPGRGTTVTVGLPLAGA
jgi:signal transduction histidine kinase